MNQWEHMVKFFKSCVYTRINKPKIDKMQVMNKWHKPSMPATKSDEPIITWVGQSTFLIQLAEVNILTDPSFFTFSRLLPRIVPPGIAIQDLPIIDIILISHDHADHMGMRSLKLLAKDNPVVLAPKGTGLRLEKLGLKKVVEHDHGTNYPITTDKKRKITFSFLPAAHWAGSGLFNFQKSQHGSWMIESDAHSIYFAGDSSYKAHFKEIGKAYPSIDVALLPIGPIEPRDLERHSHLGPQEAIQAFIDLNARQFIPMHWGTFFFCAEPYEEPIKQLKLWWKKREASLKEKTLRIMKFGKSEFLALQKQKAPSRSKELHPSI